MRSIVVLDVRQHPGGTRLWAWCLTEPDPPGFEHVWFTRPGERIPYQGVTSFEQVTITGELFSYTTRDSAVTLGVGDEQ